MNDSVVDDEWVGDVLNRKKYASFLTAYLESKNESFVINITAPWGSGKTFFLKNWHEDIKLNHPAVYFNAWENDYSNDPLVSIISCINKQIIPLLPENTERIHTAKKFLLKSGAILKKLLPIIVKGAVSKVISEEGVDDALTEITSGHEESITELSSKFAEELLSSHEAISSSIDDFKNTVELLIKEVTKESSYKSPLFVFIDELDRCRPIYSIELLERIKHIFNIPEVIFVVATDTEQLSHSVKAIYGEGFNGQLYLRRFFDQIYTLPEANCIEFATLLFKGFVPKANYFKYDIEPHEVTSDNRLVLYRNNNAENDKNTLTCKPNDNAENILLFSLFAKFFKLDLRSQQQCFDRFIAIEKSLSDKEELHFGYLIFLIMLDAKNPPIFQKYFNCNTHDQRQIILNDFGFPKDTLKLKFNPPKFMTARDYIEIYSRTLLLEKQEIRTLIEESDSDYENIMFSFMNNFEYLVKYREKVEMVENLS